MKRLAFIFALLLCGCDNRALAPQTPNTGRITVEDCGTVQNQAVPRRVYILTDSKTGRQFLAVTDCGLVEITENKGK